MDDNPRDREKTFTIGLEAINSARHLFPKLRALFVGDSMLDLEPENTKSKLEILEIRLVAEILSSSIIARLAVLAFKMAGITMQGVSTLTNSPNLENLKLLHISGSVISPEALYLLQKMGCKLDLRKNQYTPKFDR